MQILLAIIGSGALASIISGITNIIISCINKDRNLEAGVQIMLYAFIKDKCKACIERGYITSDEYEDLTRMHSVYHGPLKGNGFLDDIMKQASNLPRHY